VQTVVTSPDLIPQNIQVSPNPASRGGSIQVSWTLRNQGTATANASTTAVRVETSSTCGATTQVTATAAALGAGQAVTQSAVLPAPSSGTSYFVCVIADNFSTSGQPDSTTGNDIVVSGPFTLQTVTNPPSVFALNANPSVACDLAPPAASPAISLSWTPSVGAQNYQIYRNGVAIGSPLPGTAFYNSTGLTAGLSYSYYVVASNAGGTQASNIVSVAVPAGICPNIALPGQITAVASTVSCANGNPTFTLSWTQSLGALSYQVLRNGATYVGPLPSSTMSYLVASQLPVGGTINFSVRATNGGGYRDSAEVPVSVSSSTCNLPRPDLTVSAQSISFSPTQVRPGDNLSVSFVVQNGGPGDALASQAVIQFGSVGRPAQGNDIKVPIPAIRAGQSYSFTGIKTVPALPPGSRPVGVTIDPDNLIGQASLSNDSAASAASLQVLASTLADPTVTLAPDKVGQYAQMTNVRLTATVHGDGPFSYRWFKNSSQFQAPGFYLQFPMVLGSEINVYPPSTSIGQPVPDVYYVEVSNSNGHWVPSNTVVVAAQCPSNSTCAVVIDPYTPGACSWSGGNQRPDWPTVVITHGWEPFGGSPFTDWMMPLQIAMASINPQINFCLFGWSDAYYVLPWVSKARIQRNSTDLVRDLKDKLGTGYSKPIHFIGHSHGVGLNGYALSAIANSYPGSQIQFTAIDAPMNSIAVILHADISETQLQNQVKDASNVSRHDNYYALPSPDAVFAATSLMSLLTGNPPSTLSLGLVNQLGGFGKSLAGWSPDTICPNTFHTNIHRVCYNDRERGYANSITLDRGVAPVVPLNLGNYLLPTTLQLWPGQFDTKTGPVTTPQTIVNGTQTQVLQFDSFGKSAAISSKGGLSTSAESPASASATILIPADATTLSFDYRLSGSVSSALLYIEFNGEPLMIFSLDPATGSEFRRAYAPIASGAGIAGSLGFRFVSQNPFSSIDIANINILGKDNSVSGDTQIVEFFNTLLDHYFITASPAEASSIDQGAAGPGWSRTGESFNAWSSAATSSLNSVCRFYGSIFPGPNSHFYTASIEECNQLKQFQQSTPVTQRRWNFEGSAFYIATPLEGSCPGDAPNAIYRAYNNGFAQGIDSNHRYTTSASIYERMVTRGWTGEGIVMCTKQ
jgi:hypothetical protein